METNPFTNLCRDVNFIFLVVHGNNDVKGYRFGRQRVLSLLSRRSAGLYRGA